MARSEQALNFPPLPGALREAVLALFGQAGTLAPGMNPGLVFERFPRCWEASAGTWGLGEGRLRFLKDFASAYGSLERSFKPLLDARLATLERILPGGRSYSARWRFVTGLGADHPLENGFCFHPLLCVPYFPGSTVKGLVRVAARLSGMDDTEELRLFGSIPPQGGEQEGGSEQAGTLVFLEALPVIWPRLGVDLINNHRPTWTSLVNSGLTEVGPEHRASAAGLEDPVPVYFLVVEPGVEVRFWITGRPGSEVSARDLDRAWGWLETGLRFLGIGAKTAVGFGRFAGGLEQGAARPAAPAASPPSSPRPRLKKGDRVRFVLTRQSKKGKWQGRLEDHPDSFGTLLGDPPADAEVGGVYEVLVGAAGDLKNLNLRWP